MSRVHSENISKEVEKLEKELKKRYGTKRGAAMIADARQCVEYELDSNDYSQMLFLHHYTLELRRKLS